MADLFISFFVEQMSAFNAIFVAIIINYFSSERKGIEEEVEEDLDDEDLIIEDEEQDQQVRQNAPN